MLNNELNTIRQSLLTLSQLNNDLIVMNIGNILIQRNYATLKTPKLITGGCSGIDLNYTKFIGKGMLTASILGDIDVTPTSCVILRTIHQLNNNSNGILLIIRNCELFNFNVAYQRLINARLPVKMIIIDDNWNVLFVVSKILGAMAEQGKKLYEIKDFYHTKLVGRIVNIKIDNFCPRNDGKRTKLHENLDNIEDLNLDPNTTIVVVLNNRQLSKLDELQLVNQIINKLKKLQISIVRFYVQNLVNTQDICLTIVKNVTTEILQYFDNPTNVECWRQVNQSSPSTDIVDEPLNILELPITIDGPKLDDKNTKNLETTLLFVCEVLISCETQLNTIDLENSKGNIGTRFRTVAESLKNRLENKTIPTNCPCSLLKFLSILVENTIKGKLGSIYGILLDSAAEQFKQISTNQKITPFEWLTALKAMLETFTKICDENQRLTTMYFPLRTFYKIANDEYCKTENFIYSFNLATYGAEKAADKTRLLKQLYSDSGAHAVGIWLRAIYEGVKLTCYSGG